MTLNRLSLSHLQIPQGSTLSYFGPSLDLGPLPAIFYFALSAEASLSLDPFNQPVTFFADRAVRIFSLTLPSHEKEDFNQALSQWAAHIQAGHDIISPFISTLSQSLDFLIDQGYVIPNRVGVAGLSRGAFVATHFAAADPRIQATLGFAPLTTLDTLKEFIHTPPSPLRTSLNLIHIAEKLIGRPLRFYIGNRDTRVGTEKCFQFISHLAELSYHKRLRASPVELTITPSQGQHGHGTLLPTFLNGAAWLAQQLNVD